MNRENLEKIIKLRHDLHMRPELSMEEKKTKTFLMDYLKQNTDLVLVDCGNFFYAIYDERDPAANGKANQGNISRTLAFRADMDALPIDEDKDFRPYASLNPGVSHKCGHDGHSAAMVGLAVELTRLKKEGKTFNNRIILLFQHAEEVGIGGPECLEVLRKEKIDRIYAIHNFPGLKKGTMSISDGPVQPASQGLIMDFLGRNSHASNPEKGLNPYPAIARLLLDLDGIEKDRRWEHFVRITVVGVRVGSGAFGVNPGRGQVFLTIRAEDESEMLGLRQEILDRAKAYSDEMGLEFESENRDYFPEEKNDPQVASMARDACRKAGIEIEELPEPDRASDDFGAYLKEIPGAMCFVGAGSCPPIHTIGYDFDDNIIETMVDFYIEVIELYEENDRADHNNLRSRA